jgi:hypothetical protein
MENPPMRNTLLAFLFLGFLFPFRNFPAQSQTTLASQPEADSGSVVCPPAVYTIPPDDCLPLGPSTFLARSAAEGIPYPVVPLPSYSPDRALDDLPFQYFKVTDAGAKLYSSLDDAIANQASKMLYPASHLYVSYLGEAVVTSQGSFYQLRSGYWVFAEGGRLGRYNPPFQGLLFSSQPRNAFGWVLGTVASQIAPGVNQPETGRTWYRFNVVRIYDTRTVDGITWNMVGLDEWLDARNVRRVDPHTAPPRGVTSDRWIEVNLAEQTLTVFENGRLIFATMVSTGVDHFWTRPGLFTIREKLPTETMSNSDPEDFYYLEDVPWTMYFDEARALHGAYWHNRFGYRLSHGCVNLSPGDSHWIYDWAKVGEFVYVYDPSGETPTDPSLFGTGAP